ncbi:MAG: hypothetical protein ACRDQB_15130 [Thermocrispum sp.]
MKRRAIAAAGAATLGAATAVVALAASTTVGFAETTTSSAYGVAAEGAIPIEPTPYVESTDGTTQTSTALELPENPLISLKAADLTAGDDTASVELLDVGVLPIGELPEQLEGAFEQFKNALQPLCEMDDPVGQIPPNPITDALPDELTDALDPNQLCESLENPPSALLELGLVEVSCEGDEGSVRLVDITLLGQELPIPEAPEDLPEFPENPLLTIAANKQVQGEDGSFSVTGLEITIGGDAQKLSIGNATCGAVDDDDDDDPTATPPAPVTTGLPVTG